MNEETLLANVRGNRALLCELARLCLYEDGPRLFSQLHTAARNGDCAAIESSAHALKGLAGEFRAEDALRAAAALEAAAADGKHGDLTAHIEQMEREYETLAALLRAILDHAA